MTWRRPLLPYPGEHPSSRRSPPTRTLISRPSWQRPQTSTRRAERGRRSLTERFWGLFPELRVGAAGREGWPLARRWGSALLERESRQPSGAGSVEVLQFSAAAGGGGTAKLEPRAGVAGFAATGYSASTSTRLSTSDAIPPRRLPHRR